MKSFYLLLLTTGFFLCSLAQSKTIHHSAERLYYVIRVYHFADTQSIQATEDFLQQVYVPFMHALGIRPVGVFSMIRPADTGEQRLYVLTPYRSLAQWENTEQALMHDTAWWNKVPDYSRAPASRPPYARMETIVLRAFPDMPVIHKPRLHAPIAQRVYELRSYESPDEAYGLNKIQMFNAGGEIKIFDRLGFEAVFYAQVLSGCHMPNLMYMTAFEDMDARNAHWKAFSADSVWRHLSALPEYQHNVSHADIVFLHPLSFSDL
ncbi:NIPSNAP family protein [Thermoflavifilum thermophilum]|nr:NIPSNAP family protein [Thermoflavifilum thermophilum]